MVPDMIRMTTFLGDKEWDEGTVRPAVFSKDGSRFVVVVAHGDLEKNQTVSTILLFRTGELFKNAAPEKVLTFASSTSRPAISNVQWTDNDTLMFLGEQPHQTPQVYKLDLKTKTAQPLTSSKTPVISYNLAPNSSRVLYVASAPVNTAAIESRAAHGFLVTQRIRDLLNGKWDTRELEDDPQVMYALSLKDGKSKQVQLTDFGDCGDDTPKISPDGHYAVMRCHSLSLPDYWKNYLDGMRGWAVAPVMVLVDMERGTSQRLIDVPWYRTEADWSPDGSVVVVTNTLLPLKGVQDPAEIEARHDLIAVAAVDPRTLAYTVIARRNNLAVSRWDTAGHVVVLHPTKVEKDQSPEDLAFRREGSNWVAVSADTAPKKSAAGGAPAGLDVFIKEDLNTPPRLVAKDASGKEQTIYDPNPQFAQLAFAHEEIFKWQTADGEWQAGLYYPLGYEKGKRYPLVIQTHGFAPDKFQIEGYATTGYAGQALAGHGIMVLQIGIEPQPAEHNYLSTKEEGPYTERGYEGAIDALDSAGLIDRTKVCLEGWSRTTYAVRQMLAHSSYPITAALISDGVDFAYVRYMIDDDMFRTDAEVMNGGIPIGDNLQNWREQVPTWNADKFHTPLRIESIAYPGGGGPLTQWELYTLLKRLNKPVELVYYPRAEHAITMPWERLTSQGGAYDWFRFWLTGEEDSDPAKKDQYARWHKMREQMQAQNQ
jgi:dipeptidyl aminopeptidase/acylaminoacyl peptidase